jgi:hypothetical protein
MAIIIKKIRYIYIISIIIFLNTLFGQLAIKRFEADILSFDSVSASAWVSQGKLSVVKVMITQNGHRLYSYKPPTGDAFIISGRMDAINIVLKNEVSRDKVEDFLNKHCADFLLDVMTFTPSQFMQQESQSIKPTPIIKNNEWSIQFFVVTDLGAVERWDASGKLSPMSINRFNKQMVKPSETVERPILTQ